MSKTKINELSQQETHCTHSSQHATLMETVHVMSCDWPNFMSFFLWQSLSKHHIVRKGTNGLLWKRFCRNWSKCQFLAKTSLNIVMSPQDAANGCKHVWVAGCLKLSSDHGRSLTDGIPNLGCNSLFWVSHWMVTKQPVVNWGLHVVVQRKKDFATARH